LEFRRVLFRSKGTPPKFGRESWHEPVAADVRRLITQNPKSEIRNPKSMRASLRRLLQSPEMKPSVHIDDFAGAERKQVLRDGGDGPADILRRAPAWDGRQSFGNEFVVFVFHRRG